MVGYFGKLVGADGRQISHGGQPQSLLDAVPKLLRLQGRAGILRSVLNCNGKTHAMPDTDVPELAWSHCPLCLWESPQVQSLRNLARLSEVAPLSGWPDRFAVWAVHGVVLLREHGRG